MNRLAVAWTMAAFFFLSGHILCYPLIPQFGCGLHTEAITLGLFCLVGYLTATVNKKIGWSISSAAIAAFVLSKLWWATVDTIQLGWHYGLNEILRF